MTKIDETFPVVNVVNVAANAPTVSIAASDGRRLVTLNIVDGRLTAVYDEADLDEAARIFLREVVALDQGHLTPSSIDPE